MESINEAALRLKRDTEKDLIGAISKSEPRELFEEYLSLKNEMEQLGERSKVIHKLMGEACRAIAVQTIRSGDRPNPIPLEGVIRLSDGNLHYYAIDEEDGLLNQLNIIEEVEL